MRQDYKDWIKENIDSLDDEAQEKYMREIVNKIFPERLSTRKIVVRLDGYNGYHEIPLTTFGLHDGCSLNSMHIFLYLYPLDSTFMDETFRLGGGRVVNIVNFFLQAKEVIELNPNIKDDLRLLLKLQ